jgi:hypothetical protein
MKIEIFSFLFGVLFALAAIITFERFFGILFGNRKIKKLEREVKRLKFVLKKKDELIKKSLKTFHDSELRNEKKIGKT